MTLTVQFPKTNDNTHNNKYLKFLVSFIVLIIAEVTEFVYSFVEDKKLDYLFTFEFPILYEVLST